MTERLALIGAGRAGASLAAALTRAGYTVTAVFDADPASAERAAAVCGAQAGTEIQALGAGDWSLLFLTVSDDAIAPLAAQLATLSRWPAAALVCHCSGALPTAVLAPLKDFAALASMHPLQSFSDRPEAWRSWSGIPITLEGEAGALERLEALISRLKSYPLRITAAQKPLYHAAATLLSSGLVALCDAALQLLEGLPWPAAEKPAMTVPLLQTTLANVLAAGPAAARTGPVSRADAGTIAGHLRALNTQAPELLDLYRALSLYLVRLAEQAGRLTLLQKDELIRLLTQTPE